MNLEVKTLYNNQVAIRDKYIKRSKEKKEDIYISCNGQIMRIPYKEVSKRITGETGPFEDKFSSQKHYLIYFDWKPNVLTGEELTKKMLGY